MDIRRSTPSPLLPENKRIASRIYRKDVVVEGMSVGIDMISIFYGAGECLECRRTSTSGIMSHNMPLNATVRTAAGT